MGYGDFNSRRSGRDRSGYGGRGGYNDHDRMSFQNCPFSLGQKVRHIATGLELSVIRIGREQIECRKPDLSSDWFYEHELELIEE